jgi:hypothetical protein
MVLMYLLKGFIYMPQSIQDFVYQLVSTSGVGYVGVLLIKLYGIHPGLPLLPVIIIVIIVYFVSKIDEEKYRFSKLNNSIVPLPQNSSISQQSTVGASSVSNATSTHVTRRQSVLTAIKVSDMLLQQDECNDMEEKQNDFQGRSLYGNITAKKLVENDSNSDDNDLHSLYSCSSEEVSSSSSSDSNMSYNSSDEDDSISSSSSDSTSNSDNESSSSNSSSSSDEK